MIELRCKYITSAAKREVCMITINKITSNVTVDFAACEMKKYLRMIFFTSTPITTAV